MNRIADVEIAYRQFPQQFQSLMLSTVTPEGWPQASYAPFVKDDDWTFYVFVSGLASHTHNLRTTAKAGILLIEDEAQTAQIFARKRLMYECTAIAIARHDPTWTTWADRFRARFGEFIDLLRQLPDFQIFQLRPRAGRFVIGFGAAYQVDRRDLNRLIPQER